VPAEESLVIFMRACSSAVEQWTFNPLVESSNLSGPTTALQYTPDRFDVLGAAIVSIGVGVIFLHPGPDKSTPPRPC
jgi:hypothetical protein